MRRRALIIGPALLAAACEHGITLQGTITVPVDVQQAFSRERPGLVRVQTSIPKSSVLDYRLAVLCEPTSAPLVLSFFHDGFGCAEQGEVRVVALRAAAGANPPCGAGQEVWDGDAAESLVLAAGEETVFEGQTGNLGCVSGEDTVDIALTLVR